MLFYISLGAFAGVVVFGLLFIIMGLKGGPWKLPGIGMMVCFLALIVSVVLPRLGIGGEDPGTANEPSGAVESQDVDESEAVESEGQEIETPEATGTEGQTEEDTPPTTTESAPQPTQKVEQTIPDPVTYTGNGDDVITLAPFDGVFVFHITGNSSKHHFSVKGYDSNGENTGLFVNTTSAYDGITIDPKQETTTLEVNASGDWIIEVQSINKMETISSGETLSGSGDTVIVVSSYGSTATISGNAGNNHFAVKSYGKKRDKLLVNTTEVYEGTVMLSGEPIILEIDAVGEWSITFD